MSQTAQLSLRDEHETQVGARRMRVHQDRPTAHQYREDQNMYHDDSPFSRYQPTRMRTPRSERKKNALIALVVLVVIAVAVTVPVVLTTRKGGRSNSAPGSDSGSGSEPNHPSTNVATHGKTGSKITMEDGTVFTYRNDFDGDWAYDPKHPFGPGGKAQSWSKRVGGTEEWVWGTDLARGVNLGGWLVTEPFICPALYEKYINSTAVEVTDEWSLSVAMGDNLAKDMEEHYSTFITEKDFADIAAAGLNWVRIPIGYWAIETINNEPFLAGTSWKYFLKAVQWARKYGLRIYLDLHSLPGSQNGWNHSGKVGTVNFMHGAMGIANAQRTLTYLRIITQFVSQYQYRDVVPVVGIVNEILWGTIGPGPAQSFYYAAYDAIRTATGVGAGAGPYIAIHDGFQGPGIWEGFLTGADRLVLDQHPYLAFNHDTDPPEAMAIKPCQWALATNQSQRAFGVTLGGEFSAAINDCGLWLNGIGNPSGPECHAWDDWGSYDAALIDTLKQGTLATMDALQNYFFWTWKIGNSTVLGTSSCPLWNYQLGLEKGWIPKDPREANGRCAAVLQVSQPFDGIFPPSATGAGPGIIDPAQTALHAFPPAEILPSFFGDQVALLPRYTPTGTVKRLSPPTFTAAPSVDAGKGWKNDADDALAYVPIRGCEYPDAWNAVEAPLPTATCTGS